MSKFIIFASARSGSTSLAKVLGESKDVRMAIEPFHPKFSEWNPKERNYSKFVKDVETLNKALDEIFSKYTAIKILDYQLPEKIYFELLKRKDLKILFLRRKNLLEGAISSAVAHQVGRWHKQEDKSIYDKLKPLDINEILKWIEYVRELNETFYEFLKKQRKGGFLPLFYEDLYSESLEVNKKILKRVCDFLGISIPPDEAIKKYMTPSEAKINYKDLYKKIPNYEEIRNKLNA